MSQRNIMNERNTDNKPTGKSRKSAASAKPVTKAASSVYVAKDNPRPKKSGFLDSFRKRNVKDETPKERKAREAAEARKEAEKAQKAEMRKFKPDTPEYKKWKMVFYGCILASLLLMVPVTLWTDLVESNYAAYVTILIFAWGLLTAAIITDIQKVKPAKEEAYYKHAAIRNKQAKQNKKKK